MAIVNRTPDSYYRPGLTWEDSAAMERVHAVVAEGADIVDIGGVPAKPGTEVTVSEEIRRTVPFVEAVRGAYPDLVISVDTWRQEVGRAACAAGADLLNDSWGGWDPALADVAAEYGAGLVCSHAGGVAPRTRPFRVTYADVMADVLDRTLGLASRAVEAGVDPARILIDPAHDFGKNTWHSLEVTRRLADMVATGWRCWCRCRTRTSSVRRSVPGLRIAWPGRWRSRRSLRGWGPGCSASTMSARPARRWT
jgi:dihydropteroate synthase